MQQLSFINSRGAEIVFDLTAPYIFWKVTGLELPPVEPVYTQSAGQNGYTLHEILLESRTVKLSGHIHQKGENGIRLMYEARKKLNTVCNPLLGVGELVYQNDFGKWRIGAFCNGNPYGTKMLNIQTLDVSFECPSPFWQSYDNEIVRLAYVQGGLIFPLVTPCLFGILGYRALIDNDGDTGMPLEITIGGGAINPVIKNSVTGEFIHVKRQLSKYDSLYINTDPERLEVSLFSLNAETGKEDKTNAYGYLSDDSALFLLPPGGNDLVFTTDDNNKRIQVKLVFRRRYAGV